MVRALTAETHGNGTGIGQAEFASKRVHAQIDMQATTINCLTGGSPIGAMLPVALDGDQDTQDIEYNFHRLLGNKLTGTQFSEAEPYHEAWGVVTVPMESVTATDKWTLVIKLKQPSLPALGLILKGRHSYILAPEVIEQYGDVTDWRNVVGTGPFMLTTWRAAL